MREIEAATFQAVDEVNSLLPMDKRLAKSADTALTGDETVLDSLGLVNFLVAVEGAVASQCGATISLINEDSMSRQPSPFRTIGSLMDYAFALMQQEAHGSN